MTKLKYNIDFKEFRSQCFSRLVKRVLTTDTNQFRWKAVRMGNGRARICL